VLCQELAWLRQNTGKERIDDRRWCVRGDGVYGDGGGGGGDGDSGGGLTVIDDAPVCSLEA